MTAYRVYRLDLAGHIATADWLEADTDEAAEALALKLCGPGVPMVELWEGARRVAVLSCGAADEPAATDPAADSIRRSFRQPAGRAADWLRPRALQQRGRGGRSPVPGTAPTFRR